MDAGGDGECRLAHEQFLGSRRVPEFRLQKWSRNSYLNVGEDVAYRSTSMAPARPFWKGYLKLSLVSCPIALFPASSSSERVSFRQISKKTGHRLKQQLVDSVTGDVVESGDKGRGYQIGKDEYLPVEDEELDSLALESTHTIDIEKFVPRSEIDERYLDSRTTSPRRTRSGSTPLPSSVRP